MGLDLSASFAAPRPALPSYLGRSAVAISPRFPRDGIASAGPASGTTGLVGTITPQRTAAEAQSWGATVALWSYTDLAASFGYASPAAFVGEMTAAGVPIQATTNTRATNSGSGPYMRDAGGSNWSAGSAPLRPLVGGLQQSPAQSRITVSIDYMPASDAAGTQAPKLAAVATQMSAGCFGLHMDDPRAGAAYSHWRGITSDYDTVGQGADFSPTAMTGFAAWLGANTTTAQRTALGLPSSAAGFDLLAHLKTNFSNYMFTPGQDNPALVDNYRFRISIPVVPTLRDVMALHTRYLADDHASYVQSVRAQIGSAPLSLNFWNASPMRFLGWHVYRRPALWDFAVAETAPRYWDELSSNAVGSAGFLDAASLQHARQRLVTATCDMMGLPVFEEHKPTSLTAAPPRVVVQLLRQSIMQSVMDGATPVVPIDVFMTTSDSQSQGVNVDGYRYWGSRADYGQCFDFIRVNSVYIDGYEKCAQVHLAVHADSWPFHSGGAAPKFQGLLARMAALWVRDVDYHLLPTGLPDEPPPNDPVRSVETASPLIIRIQDDGDYYAHLGRFTAPNYRRWSTATADEAMLYSPVRSMSPYIRAAARYNAAQRRVSIHLINLRLNADGTPKPEATTLRWNWGLPTSQATVARLGEAGGTVDLSRGFGMVTLREYAILNFSV